MVELIDRWQPHIVALQEVDSRRESDVDPFEFLQRELGEHGIGAKSIITEDGGVRADADQPLAAERNRNSRYLISRARTAPRHCNVH